jgi:hypothetical protein
MALSKAKGNFEASMILSDEAKVELNWWLNNIKSSFKNIQPTPIDIDLYSDGSKTGWGAALGDQSTGGNWCKQKASAHINELEMKAAYFALKSFALQLSGKHVKLMIDNSTTVFVINNMGTSHNDRLNTKVVEMREFCMSHKIRLTAAHLPGSSNVAADKESRHVYRKVNGG